MSEINKKVTKKRLVFRYSVNNPKGSNFSKVSDVFITDWYDAEGDIINFEVVTEEIHEIVELKKDE